MSWLGSLGTAVGSFFGGPIGGLVGGGLGGVGDYLLGQKGQRDTNAASAQMAQKQMDFQERMRNTSYQAAVKDMEAAGLNPMLAYSQGGASVPSGAMGVVGNVQQAGMNSALSGVQMAQGAQAIAASKAQTDQVVAQTEKIKSETMERSLNTAYLRAQLDKLGVDTDLSSANVGNVLTDTRKKEIENEVSMYRHGAHKAGGYRAEVEQKIEDARRAKAEATSSEMGLAEDASRERFYSETGAGPQYLRSLLDILKGVSSARRIVR